MPNFIKQFFVSSTFVISILIVIAYSIFFHGVIIFNSVNVGHILDFFLALLPLILSIFAILISFTDKGFLRFLKSIPVKEVLDEKTGKKIVKESVYDSIIYYFLNNAFIVFISLIVFGIALCLMLTENIYLQYLMLFLLLYSVISFIKLVKFIFYFARKKAEYVDLEK